MGISKMGYREWSMNKSTIRASLATAKTIKILQVRCCYYCVLFIYPALLYTSSKVRADWGTFGLMYLQYTRNQQIRKAYTKTVFWTQYTKNGREICPYFTSA